MTPTVAFTCSLYADRRTRESAPCLKGQINLNSDAGFSVRQERTLNQIPHYQKQDIPDHIVVRIPSRNTVIPKLNVLSSSQVYVAAISV